MRISQEVCAAVLDAAVAEAKAINVPMNIAVADAEAHLKAFVRMDSALLGSIDIALGKARTAALFAMTTEEIGAFCGPDGTSPGLEQTNGGLVVFAGGVPLRAPGGTLVGAVGVSGGAVADDARVAIAAAQSGERIIECLQSSQLPQAVASRLPSPQD